ncbi:hypothetical protein C2845_PM02G17560 [Panicum miliaceum]|uniref:Uncharacterized protein n=1 Tax=Panicum miliaceum TaxID=4540 RepID=A0A3L6SAA1_PANMI|nr:hypothetical protein C2845_PM02G17560 [Panicum miliaceum]
MPSKDEMLELKAKKLTGAAVALSFSKRLTQLIQERVHPGYEYSGREDPTRVRNCKVPHMEAVNRVARIMSGEVRDKGCPKAYCLKRPTTEERVPEFWSPAPLPEGQQGKVIDPPAGLAKPAEGVLDYATDSSIGSESEEVVEVAGPTAGAGSVTRRRHAVVRKVPISKARKGAAHPQCGGTSSLEAMKEERGIPKRTAGDGHAGLVALKEEEAAHRLSQIQQRASPASLARSLPTPEGIA